ncbi:hypothetical protein MPER_07800, partial [Moniliophthora perniciosa FA553]
ANLNKSYFTNRQDRYLSFTNQPILSQYCFDFLRTVSDFSYQLLPASDAKPDLGPHSFAGDGYTMFWPDFNTHPHHIHKKAEKAFTNFQHSYRQRSLPESSEGGEKAMVFPIIQAGQFNVREEEQAMDILFKHANGESSGETKIEERPLIDFTSGYFGLYKPYQDLVLRSQNVDVRIVAASKWLLRVKSISGRIPEGYTLLEQRFMKAVARAGRLWKESTGVQLLEWLKDGWTYHAKGLWLSPNASSHPVLTLFGSTNLNSRSSHIDTELSFVMILPSKQQDTDSQQKATELTNGITTLQAQLADEVANIRASTHEWKGDSRKVRLGTKLLVALVGKML